MVSYKNIKPLLLWVSIIILAAACEPVVTTQPTEKPHEELVTPQPIATEVGIDENKNTGKENNNTSNQSIDEQLSENVQGPKLSCFNNPSLFPPVKEGEWIKGDKEAKITIIEYSDFMCPYCAMVAPTLSQLVDENKGVVRIVFRHFPLTSIHDKALLSAQAAEAAGLQGKFWEMHDILFENQQEWANLPVEDFTKWLISKAKGINLDTAKFENDLKNKSIEEKLQQAYNDAIGLGIPGTPTLAINGIYYGGSPDLQSLLAYVKTAQNIKQYNCPNFTIDKNKKYKAVLQMDKGDITIELFADKAPITVNSFIFLAKQGFYDGVSFHRVIPNFVAQTGDPYGSGSGGPGYQFINEIAEGLTFGEAGVVGMANAGPDTNGSQFFITYAGIPEETVKNLDGNYTIFGKVISGMEVVEKITPRDPAQNPNLPQGDIIKSIKIEEE